MTTYSDKTFGVCMVYEAVTPVFIESEPNDHGFCRGSMAIAWVGSTVHTCEPISIHKDYLYKEIPAMDWPKGVTE